MVSAKITGASAVAAIALMQICPAPQEIVLPIIGAVVSGGIGGGISAGIGNARMAKRDLPAGVSQESIDQCVDQVNGQDSPVQVYDTENGAVRADNVPPACMNLATVITGNPSQEGGPVPVVMGSSSLQYEDLSDEERANLSEALASKSD